jgi:hypothetical protein
MSVAEAVLLMRARRAYESGRALHGLETASVVVPMALVSWLGCGKLTLTLVESAALAGLVTLAVWHGRELARGARFGLAAGLVPLLLPILVGISGHVCDASVCLLFPSACLAGGIVGGIGLGFFATRAGLPPLGLATAGVVAWLTGSLGCLVAGSLGLAVLVAGLAFGLAPVLTLRRA